MSIFWRISAFPDLSGRGGLYAGGRWHTAGRPIVYLAESPAGAMLEVLVHLEVDPEDVPDNLRLMKVTLPDQVSCLTANPLSECWESSPEYTQALGEAWLERGQSLLLEVPSALMAHTRNFLFNPQHPEARLAEVVVETLRLDQRLLGR
ncbi:MAG TPA: RES family NAD+ phosphorylase [Castellaniella sp.]|nr:RES family NAD+ phosphorylase [Castellaniella sp.]